MFPLNLDTLVIFHDENNDLFPFGGVRFGQGIFTGTVADFSESGTDVVIIESFSKNVTETLAAQTGVNSGRFVQTSIDGDASASGTSYSNTYSSSDNILDVTRHEYYFNSGMAPYGSVSADRYETVQRHNTSESDSSSQASYDASVKWGQDTHGIQNHITGSAASDGSGGYDDLFGYLVRHCGYYYDNGFEESHDSYLSSNHTSRHSVTSYDKTVSTAGFDARQVAAVSTRFSGLSATPSVSHNISTTITTSKAPGSQLYYYSYYTGSSPGSYNSIGSDSISELTFGKQNFSNYEAVDAEARLKAISAQRETPPVPIVPPNSTPANGISPPINDSMWWAVTVGFFDGLKTGGKAVANGTVSTVSSLVTVGYVDWKPLAVTEKDILYGYEYAEGFAQVGANAAIAAGTMGVGCAAAQSSKLASGAVAAVDTLEGLGAGRGLVEGGMDMVKNGVSFDNSVKVASGLLLGTGLANQSCFTEGTQIVVGEVYDEQLCITTYATVNIEDIKVGDLVYSYDTLTGEVSQKEVTDTFVRESDHLNYLTIVDENGREQVIETTDSHPFWVVADNPELWRAAQEVVNEDGTILYHENLGITECGYWVAAKDLRIGDVFLGVNGELSTLVSKERVEFPEGITVYNFTVDGNHDYFVIAQTAEYGQTSVLVHNAQYGKNRVGNSSEWDSQIPNNTKPDRMHPGHINDKRTMDALAKKHGWDESNNKRQLFHDYIRGMKGRGETLSWAELNELARDF